MARFGSDRKRTGYQCDFCGRRIRGKCGVCHCDGHKASCSICYPPTVVKKLVKLGKSSVILVLPIVWLRDMKTDEHLKLSYNPDTKKIEVEKT